jgi:3-hydroxybutyryl-CoA dehydrogenase
MNKDLAGPVAVIGAGVMGRGIAYVAAVAGAEVRLVDVDESTLRSAVASIDRDLEVGVERGKVSAGDAAAARDRVSTTTDIGSGAGGARLVVEAVVERIEVKHAVLSQVEAVVEHDALIATNTSAMSVTRIMSVLADPTRGCGMHFFNPVPRMKLCELIRGERTSEAALTTARRAAEAMGKQTVTVEDQPGFATSRLNALIGNEGMRMLQDGVASAEDIDLAARLGLNHPMGPLEMGDLVGWDTRLDILEYLAGELGDRFEPTELHRRLVAAGRTGRKVGHGVYHYDDAGTRTDDEADLTNLM